MKNTIAKKFITMFFMLFMTLSFIPTRTFAATEIGEANIGSVKFDYAAGDVPKASANITYDEAGNYNNYEIEYEYWMEKETNKWWFSDGHKTENEKLTTFEDGKTYSYGIYLKAKEGYTFADNVEVYVNDKKELGSLDDTKTRMMLLAIKTIKPVPRKAVELIEITGVTTKFNVGDAPKFTGKVADNALYEIDYEGWAGDNEIITTSEYWNNRFKDWGNAPLTSFKANTKYTYNIYVKLTDEAVKNGYYFDKDKTKLSINGEFINIDSKYVSIDEGNPTVASFGDVLTMTPTENSQGTPTTPSESEKPSQEPATPSEPEKSSQEPATSTQETENKTEQTNNPKTGDTSNIFVWYSLFAASALSMLGIIVYNKKKKSIV